MITKSCLPLGHLIHRYRGPPSPTGEGKRISRFYNSFLRSGYFLISKNNNSGINLLPKRRVTVAFPGGGRGTTTVVDEALERMIRRTLRRDCRGVL